MKKQVINIFIIPLLAVLLLAGCAPPSPSSEHTQTASNGASGNILTNILKNSALAQQPEGAISRAAMMGLNNQQPFLAMLPEAAQSIKKEERERQALAMRQQQLILEQQKFQRQIEEEALQRNLLANFLEDKDKHTAANLVRAGVPLTTAMMFEE